MAIEFAQIHNGIRTYQRPSAFLHPNDKALSKLDMGGVDRTSNSLDMRERLFLYLKDEVISINI